MLIPALKRPLIAAFFASYVRQPTELFGDLRHYGEHSIKEHTMLYTIAVVLLILWLLGLVTSFTLGGFIHILLVVAIVMVLLRVISGRPPI